MTQEITPNAPQPNMLNRIRDCAKELLYIASDDGLKLARFIVTKASIIAGFGCFIMTDTMDTEIGSSASAAFATAAAAATAGAAIVACALVARSFIKQPSIKKIAKARLTGAYITLAAVLGAGAVAGYHEYSKVQEDKALANSFAANHPEHPTHYAENRRSFARDRDHNL